jgi:hypothetical protein
VEGVDAEADGGVVALDADAVADTWTGSPIDSGASALDSLLFPEVQLVGLTDAGDSISPSSDARSAADAGWDAQQDGNRDGKLAGPDAAQVADTAWTGAGVDATADAMATIGRDAQADGSHLSDAGGGKRDNGCNCSLSLREPQSRGGLVALMLGLVLAACGRKVSRRRR